MKTMLSIILSILFMLFAFVPSSFAQDSPQWHLPEDAKMRLGKGSISDIAYSPDGKRLAVGSSIGIWLYDAETGQELDLIGGHTRWVYSVSFSPDGNTLASGSADGTVLLWDLAPATPSNAILMPEDVNQDGVVNIIDLTLVASNFGATGENTADVNGDGVVNIIDLTLVAAAFGNTASAPEIWSLKLD